MVTPPASGHLLVLTTAPDPDTAERLARGLIETRLAACVNVLPPMTSFYLWKGELIRDTEYQILAKTSRARIDELNRWLREHHPYELPEVIAVPIEAGLPEYLAWIISECTVPR